MKLLFTVPEFPKISVSGDERLYPVTRIFCVGRNYIAHAQEMGAPAPIEAPFYFLKHPLSLVANNQRVIYPRGTSSFQYEMELVVAIGREVENEGPSQTTDAIFGFASGLDLTRRDLQLAARSQGYPWDLGKDFENSAVVSSITRAEDFFPIHDQEIWLEVNGIRRQEARISDLIWSVNEVISDLSKYYKLQQGDIIFTGTPAGVGDIFPGDSVVGCVTGLESVRVDIAS